MNGKQLARMIDSTHIATLATVDEVETMIREAKEYEFFAVNAPAYYFERLVQELKGTNTNPGFGCTRWSGADPSFIKAEAAKWAISLGAQEIDMVMNLSLFRSGKYAEASRDIRCVKDAIGNHALKVIIECPLLTANEIEKAVEVVIDGGADCVKSGSGMEGPCQVEFIDRIIKAAHGRCWVKAAGGIRTLETVNRLVDMGVARFGVNYRSAKKLCDQVNKRG